VHPDRARERSGEPVDDHLTGRRRSSELLADDHELVAAEAPDGVLRAHVVGQPRGDGAQHRVAGVVPVFVVDALEAIEVEEEHRQTPVMAPRPRDRQAEAFDDRGAVGQLGQRIVARLCAAGLQPGDGAECCAGSVGEAAQRAQARGERQPARVGLVDQQHAGEVAERDDVALDDAGGRRATGDHLHAPEAEALADRVVDDVERIAARLRASQRRRGGEQALMRHEQLVLVVYGMKRHLCLGRTGDVGSTKKVTPSRSSIAATAAS